MKELQPLPVSSTIIADFERAMINVMTNAFSQATHRGCFFHSPQYINRQVQLQGMKQMQI